VPQLPPTTEEQVVDYSRDEHRRLTVTQILITLAYTVGFIFVVMGRSEMGALHKRALTLAPNGNYVLLCEP
jgi:formate/nitrite transporter FocA (FNT family)